MKSYFILCMVCLYSHAAVYEIQYAARRVFRASVLDEFKARDGKNYSLVLLLPRKYYLRKDAGVLKPFTLDDNLDFAKWEALRACPHEHIMRVYDFDKKFVYTELLYGSSMLYNTAYMANLSGEQIQRYHELYDGIKFYLPHLCKHPINIPAFVVQLRSAFDHLHRLEIYHGDVKPNNILVWSDPNGRPCIKVIDFNSSVKISPTCLNFNTDEIWLDKLIRGLETFTPLYFEFGVNERANYCHFIRDAAFPFFAALAEMSRHDTFHQNIIYCNVKPLFFDVLRLFTDNQIIVAPYNQFTMRKIKCNIRWRQDSDILKKYMPMFLEQLHKRFGVVHESEHMHQKTVTLVNRVGARKIINFDELCQHMLFYCQQKGYKFKVVRLEQFSFAQQLQLLDDTDIFIAYHGAGLINAPFIRNRGVVIEILPYGFSYTMFYKFATYGRPDITYHRWSLEKGDSIAQKIEGVDPSKTIAQYEYLRQNSKYVAYWRDQDACVKPHKLIELVESLCETK